MPRIPKEMLDSATADVLGENPTMAKSAAVKEARRRCAEHLARVSEGRRRNAVARAERGPRHPAVKSAPKAHISLYIPS